MQKSDPKYPIRVKVVSQYFSHVGASGEYLTDQGTKFMSALLKLIYHLFHIKRIIPYHPQTDGWLKVALKLG